MVNGVFVQNDLLRHLIANLVSAWALENGLELFMTAESTCVSGWDLMERQELRFVCRNRMNPSLARHWVHFKVVGIFSSSLSRRKECNWQLVSESMRLNACENLEKHSFEQLIHSLGWQVHCASETRVNSVTTTSRTANSLSSQPGNQLLDLNAKTSWHN